MTQELKAYNVVATADVNPEVVDSLGCTEFAAYDADEVDAVLAEKDATIEELKVNLQNHCTTCPVKEQEEAVLADKDAEIAVLKGDIADLRDEKRLTDTILDERNMEISELKNQVHDYALGLYMMEASAEKETRHQKYKRCLAMAKWCYAKWDDTATKYYKSVWYRKWEVKWLALAEKFKEAK